MRLLSLFCGFVLYSCTGNNNNATKTSESSQYKLIQQLDQSKQPENLERPSKEQTQNQNSTIPDQQFNNIQHSKLTPLTQDNVVKRLTEYGKLHRKNKVVIKTQFGDIKIELFDETPLHRANFLYLIEQNYFKDTFFHRIVPNFIIQGGNSDLRSTPKKRKSIGGKYRIPAEINPNRIHTYGTLSGAKEYRENPDKLSAPYEFFIFCGPEVNGRHLNGNYTIFGRVTEGMNVVETIANLPADEGEWPKSNVYIEVSLDAK
jgi:peptidylprolyl isomerase